MTGYREAGRRGPRLRVRDRLREPFVAARVHIPNPEPLFSQFMRRLGAAAYDLYIEVEVSTRHCILQGRARR